LVAIMTAVFIALSAGSASALTTRQVKSQITDFDWPTGVAIGPSDSLWVADHGAHAVSKFSSAGAFEAQNTGVGTWGETLSLEGMAFSVAADEVFVDDSHFEQETETFQNHFWGLDPGTAAYTGKDLHEGLGTSQIVAIAADNSGTATDGDLYFSKGLTVVLRIKATTGAADDFTAGPGAGTNELTGPFTEARGLAVAPNGDLYVAGRNAGSEPAIFEFEASGAFIREITEAEPGQPLSSLRALAVDPTNGDLLVLEGSGVSEFDAAGTYLRHISEPGGAGFAGSVLGVAVDSDGTLYVSEKNFESGFAAVDVFGPLITIPDVTTLPAEVHSSTEVTLNGEVDPVGEPLTECFFEYGLTTAYGQTAECEPEASALGEGNAPVPVEAQLIGIAPGTYHYRLVAANADGVNEEGNDEIFFAGASIDSTSVSEVAGTSATLEAEFNPHGFPTTYHFEYDTVPYTEGEGPHGSATPIGSAGAGEVDVARTAPIAGLTPNTTYYFRAVATNSLGTVLGPQRSFVTQGAFASLLPDSRGWELVSPPAKHGGALEAMAEEGGLIQAAADGDGIAYFSLAPPDSEPAGSRSAAGVTQLLSTRGVAGGWSTADLATPHQAPVGFTPGNPSEYKLFSSDLSLGAVEPEGATPLSPQTTEKTPYLRSSNGEYTPLVTGANVPPSVHFGGIDPKPERFEGTVQFVIASPDFSHILLRSPQPLTADFPLGFEPTENIFEWSAGSLQLVSWLPPAPANFCGPGGPACHAAEVPGDRAEVGRGDELVRNAISTDGSRVVFTTNFGRGPLYLRDLVRGETIRLDAAQGVTEPGSAGAAFQYASADGSRVFFTDAKHLVPGASSTGSDLYMCQIVEVAGHLACALTDLSVNHLHPADSAQVLGDVIGGAEDGSSVYFVAAGALTEGAAPGGCGLGVLASSSCNLYRYDLATEEIRLVAVLSGADAPDWQAGANLGKLTARVSPNGRYFAFMSQRPLTGYDNRDAKTGVRDQEVFLYDAAAQGGEGKLLCASCDPSGARPHGAFDKGEYPGLLVDRRPNWAGQTLAANIPAWTDIALGQALYQSRYLSDSGRLFFNAADALVPADSNGTFDVYEFEFPQGSGQPESNACTTSSPTYGPASGGCVSLISSGTSPGESAFMDASESGDDVFFLTNSRLTGKDQDTALDLYDARVGGGELEAVKPVECSGDACQQPAVPPNDPTPGSLTFNGAGNVLECSKGEVKKSGKCVAMKSKKHKKSHKKHKKSKRTASHNRGGAK
jgi:hypothetical protein